MSVSDFDKNNNAHDTSEEVKIIKKDTNLATNKTVTTFDSTSEPEKKILEVKIHDDSNIQMTPKCIAGTKIENRCSLEQGADKETSADTTSASPNIEVKMNDIKGVPLAEVVDENKVIQNKDSENTTVKPESITSSNDVALDRGSASSTDFAATSTSVVNRGTLVNPTSESSTAKVINTKEVSKGSTISATKPTGICENNLFKLLDSLDAEEEDEVVLSTADDDIGILSVIETEANTGPSHDVADLTSNMELGNVDKVSKTPFEGNMNKVINQYNESLRTFVR